VEKCLITAAGETLSVTVSVGGSSLATVRRDDDGRRLIAVADDCLYAAKLQGRNCCVVRPGPRD
jgi:GGDEF domain-containing protein